ncbi:MAG: lipase family protein [Ignavibacteriaceae bacterium]|jgi:pimeloyl-ACP methyl ester carboxylesterase|nr:lipase family protein [Ignavibacteriaceae bacterium]
MLKVFYRLIKHILLLSVVTIGFQFCSKDESNPVLTTTHERGEIAQSNSIGTMTPNDIEQILSSANMTIPFTLSYPVETISIKYYSVDGSGSQTIVSGAILVPQGTDNLPLVSIQHGTETKRELVASVSPTNSTEGIVGLIMASMGYLAVVPDYPGFGVSNIMHPYTHAESLIPCIIDFMRAGRTYSSQHQITLDGKVFLTGYSEGGYATLVTQKAIEAEYSQEFNLTAVAPMAGPYDLYGMMQTLFQTGQYNHTAYIAYILTAYNNIYEWNRASDFFNAPYSSIVQSLFDGSKTYAEVLNQLPSTFDALMDSTFVNNVRNGNEPAFTASMQENTLLDWIPQAPINFFHGDADDISPYQNSVTAVQKLIANGGTNIQLTTIPGGNHDTSGPIAVVGAIQWFETF